MEKSRQYRSPDSTFQEQLQEQCDRTDRLLDDELKDQYEPLPWSTISELYPNEWVTGVATQIGNPGSLEPIAEARVFFHSPDRVEFEEKMTEFRRQHPDVPLMDMMVQGETSRAAPNDTAYIFYSQGS